MGNYPMEQLSFLAKIIKSSDDTSSRSQMRQSVRRTTGVQPAGQFHQAQQRRQQRK
jgi:hypothetical protein